MISISTREAPGAARQWLAQVVAARCDVELWRWLEVAALAARDSGDAGFYRDVALAGRKLGRAPIALSPGERALAARVDPSFFSAGFSLDELARLWLLLAGSPELDALERRASALFRSADLREQIALYRALPLYPEPARWLGRATEGVRSNVRLVFEAVALDNPFAARTFPDAPWNQMVLKALHLGCPVDRIVGLSERINAELVRMLRDFGRERQAARRAVDPASSGRLARLINAQGGLS